MQRNIEIHVPFGFLRIGWYLDCEDERNEIYGKSYGWDDGIWEWGVSTEDYQGEEEAELDN